MIGMTMTSHRNGSAGGRIVETEAYGDATDLASHTAVYPKSRTHLLAAEPASLYVYRSYGIHLCLNIVAHESDTAGAVLIRALEPKIGLELMSARRGVTEPRLLASGPGRLAQALGIELSDTGTSVSDGEFLQLEPGQPAAGVIATARIGITRDIERLWRFVEAGSPFVSGPRARARASI